MLVFLHSYLKFVAILYQRTPLHIAAREGYDSTVEYISDKKADINSKDNRGVSERLHTDGRLQFSITGLTSELTAFPGT